VTKIGLYANSKKFNTQNEEWISIPTYNKTCNFTFVFFYTLYIIKLSWKWKKNLCKSVIHNIRQGATLFSTLLHNKLLRTVDISFYKNVSYIFKTVSSICLIFAGKSLIGICFYFKCLRGQHNVSCSICCP
jgi:hypothetical protein